MRSSGVAALMGSGSFESRLLAVRRLWTPSDLPSHSGGHAYIHPTALCPVACIHCMYGSNLEHKGKARLSNLDIEALQLALDVIQPAKLTISGGGEPFLELQTCVKLIESASCPRIELVTAGLWAGNVSRATATLTKIAEASQIGNQLTIRVSVDSFHWDAPNPVGFGNYISLIEAFTRPNIGSRLTLSFRGLLRERSLIERRFADEAMAQIERIDEWNSRLVFPSGLHAQITYNIIRISGAASRNGIKREDGEIGAFEYFENIAGLSDIKVSTALNDASSGEYTSGAGLAFTFDFDGSYYIFGATPPDWRGNLERSFHDNLDFFSVDPITQYASRNGPLASLRLLDSINRERAEAALTSEDIASFIPDAFSDPIETAAARLLAMHALVSEGEAIWHGDFELPADGAAALRIVHSSAN